MGNKRGKSVKVWTVPSNQLCPMAGSGSGS